MLGLPRVYCEMGTAGGGWTLIAKVAQTDNVDRWTYFDSIWLDATTLGSGRRRRRGFLGRGFGARIRQGFLGFQGLSGLAGPGDGGRALGVSG